MGLLRIVRHLTCTPWRLRRAFPRATLVAIEEAVRASERAHGGEVCFAVEGALDVGPLLRGQSARERAVEVFSQLRVWDTEHNNGVLVYLLLADRDIEIVADRGVHARVGDEGWERICRAMEAAMRAGRYEEGVLAGIRAVTAHLAAHYPPRGEGANEVPDAPAVL